MKETCETCLYADGEPICSIDGSEVSGNFHCEHYKPREKSMDIIFYFPIQADAQGTLTITNFTLDHIKTSFCSDRAIVRITLNNYEYSFVLEYDEYLYMLDCIRRCMQYITVTCESVSMVRYND